MARRNVLWLLGPETLADVGHYLAFMGEFERGAELSEQTLARREPALARLERSERRRAEQERTADHRPAAERVVHRRLAHHQIGLALFERDDVARADGLLREPGDELTNGALVFEPNVELARLRGMAAARPALLDAQRCAMPGDGVQPAA